GANIIIGHHPHVLQPFNYLVDSKGRNSFAAYSLGNFFTGQKGIYRQIGGYLTVDIEQEINKKELKINKLTFNLTYVDSSDTKDYKIHLLKDVVNQHNYIKTNDGEFEAEKVYRDMIDHLSKYIPDMKIS